MLPEGLPARTLGWLVLDWCTTYLAQPDGDRKGEAWVFTDEQARFVAWWYALDTRGRFAYRRAVLVRPKGHGKSPLVAALACAELLGPVVPDGANAAGEPVGRPHPSPLVQLCAVSEAQTDNTMSLAVEMLANGPAAMTLPLDIGITRIYRGRSGKLEPVTASYRSREGQRPTFLVLDETHLFMASNKGTALAATVRRNLGKTGGRSIETTNAWVPGEDSVAEASAEYWAKIQTGQVRDDGLLYDHRQAPPDTDLADQASCLAGLRHAYGDAAVERGGWLDLERIWQEICDPATTEADARRFYLNQVVQGSTQWQDPQRWHTRAVDEIVEPGTRITLGFDGGIHDDSTALIACRLDDGLVFPIAVWERPDGHPDWEVDHLIVTATVEETFDRYDVVRLNADPAYWQDTIGRWSLRWPGIVFEWWTNRPKAMAFAIERFATAVATGQLTHTGDPVLTRHVLNAQVKDSPYGPLIRKDVRGSARKIDAAVAAVLAYEARAEAIAGGALVEHADNHVYTF